VNDQSRSKKAVIGLTISLVHPEQDCVRGDRLALFYEVLLAAVSSCSCRCALIWMDKNISFGQMMLEFRAAEYPRSGAIKISEILERSSYPTRV
jgi:hypothetical protein